MKPLQILGGFLAGVLATSWAFWAGSGSRLDWTRQGSNGSLHLHLQGLGVGADAENWGIFLLVLAVLAGALWLGAGGGGRLFPLLRNFQRQPKDAWLGGVCGGLGEATPAPSWVWRLGFALAICCYGMSFLTYVLLWIFVPEAKPAPDAAPAGAPSSAP